MAEVAGDDGPEYLAIWTGGDGLEMRATLTTEREAVGLARRAGAGLRFHDLRHSYATWLVSNRVPINDAQWAIGHEKATTLLDLYTHGSQDGGKALRDTAADDVLTPELPEDADGDPTEPPGHL